MRPFAWHLTIRLDPKTSELSDPAECTRLAETILETGEPFGLVAFRVQESRLRALLVAPQPSVRDFARHLRLCLAHRMELGTDHGSVRVLEVTDAKQFYWQLLHVLRGVALPEHDRAAEASNLPDLLNLRTAGRYTKIRLRRLLPDLDPVSLWSLMSKDGRPGVGKPLTALEAMDAGARLRGSDPAQPPRLVG